jgi:hypothetical protein
VAEVDARIAALGLKHERIVSIRQLRMLGLGSNDVTRRVRDGRLTRLHQGVYLVGPGLPTRKGRWLAAVVALLPDAFLGYRSAGVIHDLGGFEGKDTDIVVSRSVRSRKGIAVHVTRTLQPNDTTKIDGIPCTSIERTIVDLADVVSPLQLQRALERAERKRAVDYRKLAAAVECARGRHGFPALQELLRYDPRPAAEAREGLEVAFLELVTAAGLPPYQRNVSVHGYEVDAYWPEANLVIELQSYTWHSDPAAFERDHKKLATLKVAGCETLALTYNRSRRRARGWSRRSTRSSPHRDPLRRASRRSKHRHRLPLVAEPARRDTPRQQRTQTPSNAP